VSFSPETPDGYFLVSACLDGQPMLRDATTGDWIGTFAGHKGAVWSAKLCSEARLCATGSGDFSAKVWDAVTGNCLATLDHRHVVKCVDFSSDRRLLATVGKEGAARVFDVEAGLGASGPERLFGARDDSDGRKVTVNKCAWTEAGLLVCGAADGKVSVLDPRVDGDDPIAIIDVGKDAVMDLELTNGALGPTLTVCSGEQVHLVDAVRWTSTKKVIDCPVHFREEGGASLRNDGKEIVGAVFSVRKADKGAKVRSVLQEDKLVKATEYVEARRHCYIVLETEQGNVIVTEKMKDGTVSWEENPADVTDRNSLAKVTWTTGCRGAGITVGDMLAYKGKDASAPKDNKCYAHDAFKLVARRVDRSSGNAAKIDGAWRQVKAADWAGRKM